MIKKPRSLFFKSSLVLVLSAALIYVVIVGYRIDKFGFGDYLSPPIPNGITFEREKTVWDWMGLIAIPILLTFGAVVVSNINQKNVKARDEQREVVEKEKAEQREKFEKWMGYDRAREQVLQEFFIAIETLILQNNLKKSKLGSEVREVARARTLDILRRLDGDRKRLVLDFLYQTGLINIQNPYVAMNFARFDNFTQRLAPFTGPEYPISDYFANVERTANLQDIFLRDVQLHEVVFNGVPFCRAIFRNVDFTDSRMNNADLSHTDMKNVEFIGAQLLYANLTVSKLIDINFENSSLNNAHLDEAWLENVTFRNADLRHTNFQKANFINVDFRGANLGEVNFDGTDLNSCLLTKEQWGTVRSHVGAIKPDKFL